MNQIVITVTPKDIERGSSMDNPIHPIICATKRASDWRKDIRIETINGALCVAIKSQFFPLPESAVKFHQDWQNCKGLHPFTFVAKRI